MDAEKEEQQMASWFAPLSEMEVISCSEVCREHREKKGKLRKLYPIEVL